MFRNFLEVFYFCFNIELSVFLQAFLTEIHKKEIQEERVTTMVKIIPYLSYRDLNLNQMILEFFQPHLNWDLYETNNKEEDEEKKKLVSVLYYEVMILF